MVTLATATAAAAAAATAAPARAGHLHVVGAEGRFRLEIILATVSRVVVEHLADGMRVVGSSVHWRFALINVYGYEFKFNSDSLFPPWTLPFVSNHSSHQSSAISTRVLPRRHVA